MQRLHRGLLVLPIVLLLLVLLWPTASSAALTTLPITQINQHKDTTMSCTATGGNALIHAIDHAVNPPPGCPHCGYFCAPAAIAMYATYRGITGNKLQQDQIYDNGKFTQGETQADGVISTHGVGMFDAATTLGVGGDEVQRAFTWAVGPPMLWGVNYSAPALTPSDVVAHINSGTPILWCDHYGYPAGINPPLPQEWLEVNGHAKIIAGYDDQGTAIFSDDLYLIYDPWPSSGSPYWLGQAAVLDSRDLYITDLNPVENKESTVGSIKAAYQE